MSKQFRIEEDSMGEVQVPFDALYGAQTQRAVDNFPVSGRRLPRSLIRALGQIKKVAALVNLELGCLKEEMTRAIDLASQEVIDGKLDQHFPIDIYQTGSGTSSNMNTNEVIARRAMQLVPDLPEEIHPNDHVNFGQSSNDVFPSAIRIAAYTKAEEDLLPTIDLLREAFVSTGNRYRNVIKTGRTHLMDAMPLSFEQEFGGYARQLELGRVRIESALSRVAELPMGGTAVGTGVNTHPDFPARFAAEIGRLTALPFVEAADHFEAQASIDALVELSAQLKTVATSLMKIANDLRWMNSGPNAGLGEIRLPSVQPGSSIMPGKVNPVIEESTCMVCAQVVGYDTAIGVAGLSGSFELNVMLPMVAYSLLESMRLLANACRNWAERSVSGLTVREDRVRALLAKNPILVTALNRRIGYDLAARIGKRAAAEGRPLIDVAAEMCDVPRQELEEALNPARMTGRGFRS